MGEDSHWDDRYNKMYYKDFVRYYETNKLDYGIRDGAGGSKPAVQLATPITGGTSAPVVVLARLRWHKLSLS